MSIRLPALIVISVLLIGVSGCIFDDPQPKVRPSSVKQPKTRAQAGPSLIDLDEVLAVMSDTLDEMDLQRIKNASDKQLDEMSAVDVASGIGGLSSPKKLNPDQEEEFLAKFSKRLNKAKLYKTPIGVSFAKDGSLIGFADVNRNKERDGTKEKELFKIQIDQNSGRIIASDTENKYNRDHRYYRTGPGFFTGYILGRMRDQQRNAGVDTTRFGAMKMSPEGYHRTASRKAQSTAGANRSKSKGRPGAAGSQSAPSRKSPSAR
jgi:hypothetical protein